MKMALLLALLILSASATLDFSLAENSVMFTSDKDFDNGILVGINHMIVHNQLQLNNEPSPFNFIWIAASKRGSIIKIDTITGKILGEYWSSPDGHGRDPSRTTVDTRGNVWAGNRAENGSVDGVVKGSIVQIGLLENGQCVDRNGNGVIDTSSGLGDIKPWTNKNGADDQGGVSTAKDECIINYLRTNSTGVRTLAVDANNNLWVGGRGNFMHELIDSNTGQFIPGTNFTDRCGGYGGFLDKNGVLWSSGSRDELCLLRYDTLAKTALDISVARPYGLAMDSKGNIWVSQWVGFSANSNKISKFSPDGTLLDTYSTYGNYSRGVAITPDDDIWIANSGSNSVTRLGNDGTKKRVFVVGITPTV
jgi:streptogramin lyase